MQDKDKQGQSDIGKQGGQDETGKQGGSQSGVGGEQDKSKQGQGSSPDR